LGVEFFLTGAGQACNGQWTKGGLMLGGQVLSFGIILADDTCRLFEPGNFDRAAAGLIGMVGFWL